MNEHTLEKSGGPEKGFWVGVSTMDWLTFRHVGPQCCLPHSSQEVLGIQRLLGGIFLASQDYKKIADLYIESAISKIRYIYVIIKLCRVYVVILITHA